MLVISPWVKVEDKKDPEKKQVELRHGPQRKHVGI